MTLVWILLLDLSYVIEVHSPLFATSHYDDSATPSTPVPLTVSPQYGFSTGIASAMLSSPLPVAVGEITVTRHVSHVIGIRKHQTHVLLRTIASSEDQIIGTHGLGVGGALGGLIGIIPGQSITDTGEKNNCETEKQQHKRLHEGLPLIKDD